jgi:hypothetical protein
MLSRISVLPETGRRWRGVAFFLLRIGVAAGIVGWLGWHHSGDVVEAVRGIDPKWLVAALALYGVHMTAGAWRWQLLLRVQGIHLGFPGTFSLMMQGMFFSLVMPSAVGGDVVKVGLLAAQIPPGRRLRGAFTILVDRIMGMMALFAVAGVAGMLSFRFLRGLEGYLELTVYALLCGCLGGLAAALGLCFHRRLEKIPPIGALLDWANRLTRGAVHHFAEALDAFRAAWPTLLGTFLIGVFCIHVPIGIAIVCLARGFGAEAVDPLLIILATALGNTVGAIPATPSGIGTRDVVVKHLLVAAGMAAGTAVAITMVFTGMILAFNLLGGLFFIARRRTPFPQPAEDDAGRAPLR